MKKILIIGATGETGVYITDYLLNKVKGKYEIIAVGQRKTAFFKKLGIEYHSIDISNAASFESLPKEDIYAVVYTAAVMPARMEGYYPMRYLEVNVCGTLNVLEYCRKVHADRIIYTQTIRDVGNKIGKEVIKSDSPRDFSYQGDHAMYVISKNAAVDMIEHYYQEYGLKRFILRLPTIYLYSPDKFYCVNGEKREMGFRILIDNAIKGENIEVWGDPNKAHDITYVKDLAQIVYLACICNTTDGGMYNVGTGLPISLIDQVKGIIEVFGEDDNKSRIIFCPEKPSARQYDIDISKTINELGYKPLYSYSEYLKDFKIEMQQNRFAELYK